MMICFVKGVKMKLKFLLVAMIALTPATLLAKAKDKTEIEAKQAAKLTKGQIAEAITIKGQWARPAFREANTAAFMIISNKSNHDIYLTDANCCTKSLAKKVELHTHKMEGNVARMRPVGRDGIRIPAKGSVKLKRGGLHVMLIGLNKDVRLGRNLDLNLHFSTAPGDIRNAWIRKISFPVHSRGPMQANSH
jgi:copper(I)-binding protein